MKEKEEQQQQQHQLQDNAINTTNTKGNNALTLTHMHPASLCVGMYPDHRRVTRQSKKDKCCTKTSQDDSAKTKTMTRLVGCLCARGVYFVY